MTCDLPAGSSLIDDHFAGAISPSHERTLRLHLPGCSSCREQYERQLLFSELDPDAKSRMDRLAVGLGLRPAAKSSKMLPVTMVFCTAAALLLALVPLRERFNSEFLARGSATASATDPKLLAYRIEHGRLPRSLGAAMRAADELAFAYANPGGYEKLMIFAVDEHRHVYWYHPEWSNQADDPHAISIAPGAEVREIPAAVSHSIDGTTLTLFAVFSNEDFTVRQIEQMVQRARSLDDPLPLRNAAVKKVHLSVEP